MPRRSFRIAIAALFMLSTHAVLGNAQGMAPGDSSMNARGMGTMDRPSMGSMNSNKVNMDRMPAGHMGMEQMHAMMTGWPQGSMGAAKYMMDKYGAPTAMTAEMATWGKTGPWKRTVVYGTEYPHEFPAHHTDVMQQWLDYKVPPKLYSALAAFDGSVVVERTSGEMSARCDKEAANFLALNLADEIVRGKRSVKDARRMYGEQIVAMKAGKSAPYTERLMFGSMMNTNDPDQAGEKPSVMVDEQH